MATISIIDHDVNVCETLHRFLKKQGHKVTFYVSAKRALKHLVETPADIIFCESVMPDMEGMELIEKIKQVNTQARIIVISANANTQATINLIKHGAFDFIAKPLLVELIKTAIEKALATAAPVAVKEKAPVEVSQPKAEKKFVIGKSKESEKFQTQIKLVAPTNYSVIIYGESGTGKESAAYNIHNASARKNKPFVAVDCGTLTKELAGSELFGHEKGAFTGAMQSRIGQFELANGGTIFLDEIANLSYDVQVSLLRVIQERKIRRVGSSKEINVDVRIIVASNERISTAIKAEKFRQDLYYRLNEFEVELPPLRDIESDILVFANFFLNNSNEELGKNIRGFSPSVEKMFLSYNWPGNLREMGNMIKRSALLCDKDTITHDLLSKEIIFQTKFNVEIDKIPEAGVGPELKSATLLAEGQSIMRALRQVNYNKSKACILLNIDRRTLYNKIEKLGLMKGELVTAKS